MGVIDPNESVATGGFAASDPRIIERLVKA